MDKRKRLQLELSPQERKQVEELLSGGVQPVRAVIRALVLRQMDEGRTTVEAGAGVGISAKAAWEIGKRYQEDGLEAAIYDAPRPGQKPLLDAEQGQRIIAMVCGPPPAGRARWSVRLIAQEAVKRKLVEHVGPETVRILLQSHDLKPWREKNVVRGGIG
jgi:transposase